MVRALGLLKVSEAGLGGCDASLLLCIAAMCSFLGVVREMSSCHLEGQQMALLLMRDAHPDVAHQSMALLLFASEKVVSGVKVQGLERCDVHRLLAASLTRRTC